jgi:hypothetical protein
MKQSRKPDSLEAQLVVGKIRDDSLVVERSLTKMIVVDDDGDEHNIALGDNLISPDEAQESLPGNRIIFASMHATYYFGGDFTRVEIKRILHFVSGPKAGRTLQFSFED